MKKRLLCGLLAALLAFQPMSAEAAQDSFHAVSEEIISVGETEMETEEQEETEPETETETETETAGEEQEVLVENIEGIYQAGSFAVPTEKEGSEPLLHGTEDEKTWEEWETDLYENLKKRSTSIDVSKYHISESDFTEWYAGVINENSDLYFVKNACSYSLNSADGSVSEMSPAYSQEYDDEAFEKATATALSVLTDDMTDLQKAIALHDYIILNCEYDHENYLNGTVPDSSFTAYGVLVERTAVCQGYALAYKYLLGKAGVRSNMVVSETMHHAWNTVEIDGNEYQVDTTWDDPVLDIIGRVSHWYMLASAEKFSQTHYGGQATSGHSVLSLTSNASNYDDSFWVDVNSPLILIGENYYYIDDTTRSINCIPANGGSVRQLYPNIGTWYEWGSADIIWGGAYSGLFLYGERLYFNTPYEICSIKPDGTDKRTEFTADTTNGYIYGSAYCQGKVKYAIHHSPDFQEKEEVLTVKLEGVEELPVYYKVTFIGADGEELKREEVMEGHDATPPEESSMIIPNGYAFAGWEGNYRNVQKNEIVTVKFEPVSYTITYHLNGGTNSKNNPASYTIETPTIELEEAEGKEGYIFAGWYSNENYLGKPIRKIRTGSTGNITLYAKWKDERGLWMEDIAPFVYTGKAIKPENITVYYGDRLLRAGIDYTVSYKNNTNANTLSAEKEMEKAPTVIISGKGNYAGSVKKTFAIMPKNIEDEDVQADDLFVPYKQNKVNRPVPVVKWEKKPVNKKDFKVLYPDTSDGAYEMPGTYEVVIKGTGNCTGTRTIHLTVAGENERLISRAKISAIPAREYTGNAVVLTEDMMQVTYNGEPLIMDKDYTLEYGTCINPGTYEVLVKGKGSYKGVKRISFKILGIPVTTMKVGKFENPVYCGGACTIAPEIYDKDGNLLKEGEHYKLTFANHTKSGTAQMFITGMNQYSGTIRKNFKILPYSLEEGKDSDIKAEFVSGTEEQVYEKDGAKPKVKVTFKGVLLTEGADYTVSYKNNTKVNLLSTEAEQKKAPTVLIKGKNNFTKSISLKFAIGKKNIADVFITVPDVEAGMGNGEYKSSPILIDENGKKLTAGKDYLKSYKYYDADGKELADNAFCLKDEIIKIVVTGTGNYEGITSEFYKVIAEGTSIADAKVKIKHPVYYTGEEVTFSDKDLEIKLGGKLLCADDYEIVGYFNNVRKGRAQMILKGKGEYGGVKQITFTIKARPMQWWKKEIPVTSPNGSEIEFSFT